MVSTTIITSVPPFVSPEQHRELVGTTPDSFNDIPPVLRHKEENVAVTFDPPLVQMSTEDASKGVLYVIDSALFFMSSIGCGFQIAYPTITLHAISRAEGSDPSIYCQLDEGENEDTDTVEMRELIITPQNPNSLEPIFEALSLCASLHPDPSPPEDDDFDDQVFGDPDGFEAFTGGEGEELSEVGRAALDYLESIIDNPFEQRNGVDGHVGETEHESSGEETRD
ncbi:regulator of volume decrease after cellular swelling-domain-containing protein [Scleroderma yunnanense]